MITLKVKKEVQVQAKTLLFHAKVSDRGSYTLLDQDRECIVSADESYVPGFFPGEHYGDYIDLEIDIATGLITNWPKLTAKEVGEWVVSKQEEEEGE